MRDRGVGAGGWIWGVALVGACVAAGAVADTGPSRRGATAAVERAGPTLGPWPQPARDRWSLPLPAVRVLERRTRHRDGRPLVVHAVLVDLCAGGLRMRATAPDEAFRSVPAFADSVSALVAINGDYFDVGPPSPLGPACGNGRWWATRDDPRYECLVAGGRALGLRIADVHESRLRADPRVTDVVSAAEHIVRRGRVTLSPYIVHAGRHPRAGLGLTADGRTLVLAVADGRRGGSVPSVGATSEELGAILVSLGVDDGARLDGGGSATLWVRGLGVVNHPSDGFPRRVANHLALVADPGAAVPPVCSARSHP